MRCCKLSSRSFFVTLSSLTSIFCALAITSANESGLSQQQSKRLDQAVERGLQNLASLQQRDGSFPTLPTAQPGVTCLSTLALMSAGHLPDSKPYGEHLKKAIRFTLHCERENGLFTFVRPNRVWQLDAPSHIAYYNHAIAGLMLAEVSGQLEGKLSEEVYRAVEHAIEFTVAKQFKSVPKRPQDEGGWRYPVPCPQDDFVTDLSITAWQVTFLRSAKNAGFDVDEQTIQAAIKYVRGMYDQKRKTFTYDHRRTSRGMAGAGIMALAMLGEPITPEAEGAINWIAEHPFQNYGQHEGQLDRFQYSLYYCTQGMYHQGDEHFNRFFPRVANLLIENQHPDGSWPATRFELPFGNAYTTSMSVLALTTNYAMLPIHQR